MDSVMKRLGLIAVLIAVAFFPYAVFAQSGKGQLVLDEHFMSRALELARLSVKHGNQPFGAVLVKNGKVVAEAENTINTEHSISRHAEVNVIDKVIRERGIKNLKGYTLYASTEPCVMCSGLIFLSGIDTVVYGAPASFLSRLLQGFEEIRTAQVMSLGHHQVIIRGPVLKKQAEKILFDYINASKRELQKLQPSPKGRQ